MLNIKPKYVVDEKGRKTAVVLSIKDYRALMQRLQDLEDALDLDRAVERQRVFGNTLKYEQNIGRKYEQDYK